MLSRWVSIALLALTTLPINAQSPASLEASRKLAQDFGQQLQAALSQALSNGTPEQAIAVCRDEAPRIASQLARQSGAKIHRTSRRFRNPMNAPEPWEEEVLSHFFQAAAEETDKRIEFFESNGNTVRYMQAIRIGGVCIVCHGQTLTSPIQNLLHSEYPYDRARDYELNDLRGAFSITWPATNRATTPSTNP